MTAKKLKIKIIWIWMFLCLMIISIVLSISNLPEVQRWWTEATGKNAEIVVPTQQPIGQLRPIWRAASQGLEGDESMLEPIVGHVRDLNVDMIRIDHVLSNYQIVSRNAENRLVFDFNRLDRLVRSILQTGARPMFSLSYMPPELAVDGQVTSRPIDWIEWRYLG